VNPDVADVRVALIRQWELIADAIGLINLSAASRCTGWTNREVLAHLYVQPHIVARFLRSESANEAVLGITENLSGTRSFSELIDASARKGASMNKVELRDPLYTVRQVVLDANLEATITTLQGSISVSDYLVTRCVEAVVHGCDLAPSVSPDPTAQAITSKALLDALSVSAPALVAEAADLPVERWIDLATGRSTATGRLAHVLPVME
jgi:Mycothiol maleylpyruvate isomerase N-terminal domain